jgi:hypothetical protein
MNRQAASRGDSRPPMPIDILSGNIVSSNGEMRTLEIR